VKYNSSGTELWNRTWGGSEGDGSRGVAVDSYDNIYITGFTKSFGAGERDMVLVKYNSSGTELWNRTWGGSWEDESNGVAVDSFDNIYIVGSSWSGGVGDLDIVLVKYNSSGTELWYRGCGNIFWDEGYGVAVDSSDNVYLVGTIEIYEDHPVGLSNNMALVKYDSSGTELWCKTEAEYYVGYGVAVDSSDNMYIVIFNRLVKYHSSGVEIGPRFGGGSFVGCGVAVDSSDNAYLTGYTESSGAGGRDMVLVKYPIVPDIKINSPSQNEFFGSTAPDYNINFFESDVNITWYTLDSDKHIIFSGVTGTINQTEWDKKGEGKVTIRFYANDIAGKVGYTEVTVRKDTIAPTSSISYVVYKEPNIVNKSTTFTIVADDGSGSGVSVLRYKIDNSDWFNKYIDFYALSFPIVTFNLSQYAYGIILISYQAIDEVGNIVTVKELVKLLGPSSYNFIIIIIIVGSIVGVVGAGITIFVLRNKKRAIKE